MTETPRAKFHVLRPAASVPSSPARPPALGADSAMRPILQSKKDFRSPRRPSKLVDRPHPADTYTVILPEIHDAVKPGSRGEGDGVDLKHSSNQVLRPRSNGPEAGDVSGFFGTSSSVGVVTTGDATKPLLASDLYFELQKQAMGIHSPRRRQTAMERHLYHDKMQQKYHEMRVLRARVKQLEADLAKNSLKAATSDESPFTMDSATETPHVVDKASSPAKTSSSAVSSDAATRDRIQKLERHLMQAKNDIATLNDELDVARTNDKAKIDTLQAKLELERVANKVLGERVHDVDASLKVCVSKLTEAESALAQERQEREAMISQLTAMSRQAISDHRRRAVSSKVKGVISSMGKGTLQTKLDATTQRLVDMENAMKQVQMEALAWKKEALHRQAMLAEAASARMTHPEMTSPAMTWNAAMSSAQGSMIAKLLDLNYTHGVSDRVLPPHVVFHGGRVIDGHSLQLHVVHSKDPYAFHVVGYDSSTAQEDMVSFFLDDLHRLLPHRTFFDAPATPAQLADLVNVLCGHLAVGFKNGTFFLVERPPSVAPPHGNDDYPSHKVTLYRGNGTVSGHHVSVVVNELYRSGFMETWSLEVLALSVADEIEWSTYMSMDQVARICPHFESYVPHEAKGHSLPHLVDANELLLQPLLETLAIDSHGHLVSLAIPSFDALPPSQVFSTTPSVAATAASPPPLPASPSMAFRHDSLTSIQGTLYYLTLRELWDGTALLQASLFDAYQDALVVHTWNESDLLALMHCASVLDPPLAAQFTFQQGIDVDVRPTLAQLVTGALHVAPGKQLELRYDQLARSLRPSMALRRTSMSIPDSSADIDVVGPVNEADAHRTLGQLTYPRSARGLRLRDGSFALAKVYCTKSAPQKAYVVKLTQLSAAAVTWLVVYHRLPLEFVLAMWMP
ncbi:hypothetical protein H310_06793 [Aphanomyces invadans]|uniref:Uncharacterized protein n=1 Tax=Aphanomyces invadans TaxID=157072 RepID=A0A024U5M5_9STRA|nr:hypothetical protein H310_06793 [Aphanomyces invadans]ETW01202.1 hypothetical protein H310_06793 [Aphanomyces invadans]|eukprot:XP_008870200.1 hypothetical protein H310_06793 [Aphanomyces invadans]